LKKPNILVFDEFVYVVGSSNAVFTDAKFNDMLGRLDQTALFAVADSTAGTAPSLTVQIQHSADGRNWVNKNTTAEISNVSVPTGATTALYGYDPGSAPSGANVRLAVFLGGTGSPSAHVKVFVCDRDQA
jgi:hypothetical protein